MSTIDDVLETLGHEQYSSMMFGYTAKRRKWLNVAFTKVRKAVKKERKGKDLEDLSLKVKLGPSAEAAYQNFLEVIKQPGEYLFPIVLASRSR